MPIPDYQTIMLPLLQYADDGQEHRFRDAVEGLSDTFGLTPAERKELLPSGRAPLFQNRVGWAKTYLTKAALLETTKWGHFRITARGLEVLHQPPERLDAAYLRQFPEFIEFRERSKKPPKNGDEDTDRDTSETPEESLEAAHTTLKQSLVGELLQQAVSSSWPFFERLVVDLLVAMGYGGSRRDAGQATQLAADEGVDGLINEDRLGLDVIYLQAKKWEPGRTVGRPELQKFAGALQGKRAKKGVFITTSAFSREAQEYAATIDTKIILIDGQRLGELMFEHDVGVSTTASYEVKQLDADYFDGS